MNSAYTLANKEIEEIRRKNAEILARREAEVREKVPEFAMVEAQLSGCGLALAECVLKGVGGIEEIRRNIETTQRKKAEILKSLSLPSDYLDDIYNCKKCRDTGFDDGGHRCECLNKMVSKYIGVNSNLTELMRQQTFDNFDIELFENQPDVNGYSVYDIIKGALNKAMTFADTFEKNHSNLYIYGDAGTGKTYMSSCIANRVLQRGYSVYYQSAFRLLDMMEKLKFGRYDDDERVNVEYAAKYTYDVDLLIIDDVGTEFVTAYSSAALFDIVNTRLAEGRSTVISSNLGPVKISEIYGTRFASRITGSFDTMRFIGRDLRRVKK